MVFLPWRGGRAASRRWLQRRAWGTWPQTVRNYLMVMSVGRARHAASPAFVHKPANYEIRASDVVGQPLAMRNAQLGW